MVDLDLAITKGHVFLTSTSTSTECCISASFLRLQYSPKYKPALSFWTVGGVGGLSLKVMLSLSVSAKRRKQRKRQQHRTTEHTDTPSTLATTPVATLEAAITSDGFGGKHGYTMAMVPNSTSFPALKRPRDESASSNGGTPLPQFAPPRVVLSYDHELLESVIAEHLLGEEVIGLDIEWRPTFVRGAPPSRVGLIQLSSAQLCVLVPVRHLRTLPPSLLELLQSESTWKVGCGVTEDANKLLRDLGVVCSPVVEIGTAAERLQAGGRIHFPRLEAGCAVRPGLKAMASACGVELAKSKSVTRSNWEKRPLSPAQQKYAAEDAYSGFWLAQCIYSLAQMERSDCRPSLSEWLGEQATDLQAAAKAGKKARVNPLAMIERAVSPEG